MKTSVTAQIECCALELITTHHVALSVVTCPRESWVTGLTGWVEWAIRKRCAMQCDFFFIDFLEKEIKIFQGEGKDFSIFFRRDGELHFGPIADYFYPRNDLWFRNHFCPTSSRPCDPTTTTTTSRHFWRCSRRLRLPPPPAQARLTSPTLEQVVLWAMWPFLSRLSGL